MQKKYIVRLTDAEREMLSRLVKKRRVSCSKGASCPGPAQGGC